MKLTKKTTIFLLAILSFLVVAYGCDSMKLYTSPETKSASKGETIATVNGKVITVEEFNREVANLPDYLKALVQTPEGKKEFLDNLITRELIVKEAAAKGLDNNPEIKNRLEIIRKGLLVDAFLRQFIEERTKISDAELEEIYKKDPSKFGAGERIKVSHILVASEKEAKDILAKINKGEDFAKLAKKYSTDPGTKESGGDLGYFGKGQMDPNFEKAAFDLKKAGDLSGVVKTQFGFHILKLADKKTSEVKSFEAVKEEVKKKTIQSKQKESFELLVKGLKEKASISVNEAALKGGQGGFETGPDSKGLNLPPKEKENKK